MSTRPTAETQQRTPVSASPRDIEHACRAADPKAAREALLAWAATRWPQRRPAGLEGLAQRFASGPATQIFRELDRSLYAEDSNSWDGTAAWKVLGPLLRVKPGGEQREASIGLPELYPRTR